ncbi:MAG: hypothetical protein M3Y56_06335 [Armatimonadota bacterium]|nr:hypothetical protein [Armatimonadota bacterium]
MTPFNLLSTALTASIFLALMPGSGYAADSVQQLQVVNIVTKNIWTLCKIGDKGKE